MDLIKFKVTEFRSVVDSGWIDVEDITAFIGTNESGKTNILLPLWKLNPVIGGQIELMDDLPRDKLFRDKTKRNGTLSKETSVKDDDSPKDIIKRNLYSLTNEPL